MSQNYEIILDNNTNNIKFEVDIDNRITLNDVSLHTPRFFDIGLLNNNFNVDSSGNVNIVGSLNVQGTFSTIQTDITIFKDRVIEIGNDVSGNNFTNDFDAGFIFNRGLDKNNVCMIWDESLDSFVFGETPLDGSSYSNINQLNIDPIKYFSVSSTEAIFNTSLRVGPAIDVTLDNNYNYDTGAVSIVNPDPTNSTKINDSKDVLYLLRDGTSGQSLATKAAFSLSRYENDGIFSKSKLNISLADENFDDNNVLTLMGNKKVGVGKDFANYNFDVDGSLNVGLDSSVKFRYINLKRDEFPDGNSMHVSEIQCWIDNSNICQNGFVNASFENYLTDTTINGSNPESSFGNNLSSFSSTQNQSNPSLLIDLQFEYVFNRLQALVLYNISDDVNFNNSRIEGIKLELLDSSKNVLCFFDTISDSNIFDYYKYKGPQYNSLSLQKSGSFSSTKVLSDSLSNSSETIKLYDYYSDNSDNRFKGFVEQTFLVNNGRLDFGSGLNRTNVLVGINSGKLLDFINNSNSGNTTLGSESMENMISGSNNTAVGYRSLNRISTGDSNTIIGSFSDSNSRTSLSKNTLIGFNNKSDSDNTIIIGNNSTITSSALNSIIIGSDTNISTSNTTVLGARDQDISSFFGRAVIGYNTSDLDFASFSHFDKNSATDYAFKQSYTGATYINSTSGQFIRFDIGGNKKVQLEGISTNPKSVGSATDTFVNSVLLKVEGSIEASKNMDIISFFGNSAIGFNGDTTMSGASTFSHADFNDSLGFGFMQTAIGNVKINAPANPTGKRSIGFGFDGVSKFVIQNDLTDPTHTFKIGVNTTSPINVFDILGNLAVGSSYAGTLSAPSNGLLVEGSTVIGTEDSNNLQDSNKLIVAGNVKFLNPADDSEFLSATVNNFTLGSVLNVDLGTGNTGIGTITPTNKLDVLGGVAIGTNLVNNLQSVPTDSLAVEGDLLVGYNTGIAGLNGTFIVTGTKKIDIQTSDLTNGISIGTINDVPINLGSTNSNLVLNGNVRVDNSIKVSNNTANPHSTFISSDDTIFSTPSIFLGGNIDNGVSNGSIDKADKGIFFRNLVETDVIPDPFLSTVIPTIPANSTPYLGFMGYDSDTQKFIMSNNVTKTTNPDNNNTVSATTVVTGTLVANLDGVAKFATGLTGTPTFDNVTLTSSTRIRDQFVLGSTVITATPEQINFLSNLTGDIQQQIDNLDTSTDVVLNGNIGINVTTAINSLDVNSNLAVGVNYAGLVNAPTNGLIVEGKVGIGKSSISTDAFLEVAGPIFADVGNTNSLNKFGITSIGFNGTDTNHASFFHSSVSDPSVKYALSQDSLGKTIINSAFDQFISFRNNNIEKMILNNLGNVGIGSSNPVNKLEVAGSTTIGSGFVGITGPTNGMIVEGQVGIGLSTNLKSLLDVAGNISVGTNYAGSSSAPVDGVIIEGTVGIGTSNPLSKLDVAGAVTIGSTFAGVTGATNNGLIVEGNTSIGTTDSNNKLTVGGSLSVGSGFTNITGPSNGMIIEGSIGVGTSSTSNKLDIDGNVAIGSTFAGSISAPTGGLIVEGNVGIGTSTPNNKLDVEGGVVIGTNYSGSQTAPSNGALIEGKLGIGTSTANSNLDVNGNVTIGSSYSGVTGAPTDGMIVKGNVGIGTPSPSNKLDVNGAIAVGSSFAGVTGAPTDGMIVKGNVGIGTPSPTGTLDINGAVVIGSGYAGITGAPTDGLIVKGNVGIGTSNPTGTFNVTGSSSISLETTDTTNGINIGTTGTGVPITIGDSQSTILINNQSSTLTVAGNLVVQGTTTTVSSEDLLLEDPVITLGGVQTLVENDLFDRGIEFRYFDSDPNIEESRIGFYGYDNDQQKFIFLINASKTTSPETYSGTTGIIIANLEGNADSATTLVDNANVTNLTLNGSTIISGSSNITGNVFITGSTTVTGLTTINNNLIVTGNSNVSGNTNIQNNLTVTGNSNLNGTLDVIGITNITGATTISGITNINNNLTINGSLLVNASQQLKLNTNSSDGILIGTSSSVPISIGNTVSEVTIGDNLNVTGNLVVTGETTTILSNVVDINSFTIKLGNKTGQNNDSFDRGVEFDYFDTQKRSGFFGYQDSTNKFIFLTNSTRESGLEIFTGTLGVIIANLEGNADSATTLINNANVSNLTLNGITNITGDFKIDGTNVNATATEINSLIGVSGVNIQDQLDSKVDPDNARFTAAVGINTGVSVLTNMLDINGSVAIGEAFAANNTAPTNGLIIQGNVGIGTSNPLSTLDVNGPIRGAYDSNTTSYFGKVALGFNQTVGDNSTGDYEYAAIAHVNFMTQLDYAIMQSNTGDTYLNAGANHRIYVNIDDSPKLILNEQGNFLFGSSVPETALSLVNIKGATVIGSNNAGNVAAPTDGLLVEGNVGIGTTSPLNKTDIGGSVVIGSSYAGVSTAPTDGLLVQGQASIGTNSNRNALDVAGSTAIGSSYAGINQAPTNSLIVQGKLGVGTNMSTSDTTGTLYVTGNDKILLETSDSTNGVQIGTSSIVPIRVGAITSTTTIQGNLVVSGSLDFGTSEASEVQAEVLKVEDPIITVGFNDDEDNPNQPFPPSQDGQNRGIEFFYYFNGEGRRGFIGYNPDNNLFDLLLDATNSNNNFAGTKGTLNANINGTSTLAFGLGPNVIAENMTLQGSTTLTGNFTYKGVAINTTGTQLNMLSTLTEDLQTQLDNLATGRNQNLSGRIGINIPSPVNNLDVSSNMAVGSDYAGKYTAPENGMIIQNILGVGVNNPSSLCSIHTSRAIFGASNSNVASHLGRAAVGYNEFESDFATFSHIDVNLSSNFGRSYALGQDFQGGTRLNAADGMKISFRIKDNEKAVLTREGNFGVGITPVNKGDFDGAIAVGNTYSGNVIAPTDGAIIRGSVGIGTSAPQNKLDVAGNMVLGSSYSGVSTAPTNGLLVEGSLSLGQTVTPNKLNVVGNAIIGSSLFASNSTATNGLAVEGNLGVGISNPTGTLEITGSNKIEIETSDTINGIKIGTTSKVPITIGNSESTVTIGDNMNVLGNLSVQGVTTTVNSVTVTIDDPVLTLGGDTDPSGNDNLDRGVEFRYFDVVPRIGFMGFDDSTKKFMMLTKAINNSEVFSGEKATLIADLEGNADSATTLVTGASTDTLTINGTTTIADTFVLGSTTINSTGTEINNLTGSTSNIQNQIDTLATKADPQLTGSVSINVTTPQSSLDVNNNVSIGSSYAGTIAAPTNGLIVEGKVGINNSNPLNYLSVGGSASIGSNYTSNTAPTNGLLVEGNVGIGVASPTNPLEVSGLLLAGSDSNSQSRLGYSYIGHTPGKTRFASFGHIDFANQTNSFALASQSTGETILNAKSGQHISFSINNSQKAVLLTSGNFGIGTTTPVSKLDVNGNLTIGESYSGINAAPTGGLIVEGNVGIGTTSPSSKLEVVGSIRADYNQNTTSYFGNAAVGFSGSNSIATFAHINNNSSASYAFAQESTGNTIINTKTGNQILFRINNTNSMVFDSQGQLGIGVTSPSSKLDVNGGVRAGYQSNIVSFFGNSAIGYNNLDSGSATFSNIAMNNGSSFALLQNSLGETRLNSASLKKIIFSQASITKMTLDTNGNFGIGTTVPKSKLDVFGNLTVGRSYSGINSAPTDGLLVEGNVGIGTTNPVNKLDIFGSAVIGTSNAGVITAPNNGLIVEGDVGIGTSNPTGSFEVVGTKKILMDTTNLSDGIKIGTNSPNVPITIGNSSSEVTIGDNLTVSGNLTVNGESTLVSSTTIVVDDPVFTLGGSTNPTFNDGKDRGIEFRFFSTGPTRGFMGFSNSQGKFVMLTNVINNNEVFTGVKGTLVADLEGNASTATTLIDSASVSNLTITGITSLSNTIRIGTTTINTTANEFNQLVGVTSSIQTQIDSKVSKVDPDFTGKVGVNTVNKINTVDIDGSVAIGSNFAGVVTAPNNGLIVNGSVGIGEPQPLNNLDIKGSAVVGVNYSGNNIAPTNGMLIEGRVGIGSSNPQTKLDVSGSIFGGINSNSQSIFGHSYIGFNPGNDNLGTIGHSTLKNETNSYSLASSDAGLTYINSKLGQPVIFSIDANEKMRLDQDGKLGIGTNNPSNYLDVNGNAAIGSNYAGLITAPDDGLIIEGSLGVGTDSPSNKLDIIGSASIGSSSFKTSAPTNGLIIEGNVGIGTNNPLGSFEVNVSDRIDIETTNLTNGINIGTSQQNVPVSIGNAISLTKILGDLRINGELEVIGSMTVFTSTIINIENPVFNLGGDKDLSANDPFDRGITFRYFDEGSKKGFFGYDDSQKKFTNLLDTNESGNNIFSGTLGTLVSNLEGDVISTSISTETLTASTKLDVVGGISVGTNFTSETPPDDGMIIEGNVGIGTSTPSALLDVNGAIRISHNSNTSSFIGRSAIGYTSGTTDSAAFSHLSHNTSSGFALSQSGDGNTILNSSQDIKFNINNSNKMILSNNGNFGIGTNNPTEKLEIVGNMKNSGTINSDGNIILGGNTGSGNLGAKIIFGTASNTVGSNKIDLDGTNIYGIGLKSNKVSYHTDTSHDFFVESTSITDGIQKLKIDSSGVEIFDSVFAGYNKDSTSYFGKAAVGNAGINGSASFSHINKNNENDYALIQDSNGITYLNSELNKPIKFRESNSDRMTLISGNLGLGTADPKSKLHVSENGKSSILIENSSGSYSNQDQSIEFTTDDSTTSFLHQKSEELRIGTTGTSGKIKFYTGDSTDGQTHGYKSQTITGPMINQSFNGNDKPSMLIDTNGNVGIGTTSIEKKNRLHVGFDKNEFLVSDGKITLGKEENINRTLVSNDPYGSGGSTQEEAINYYKLKEHKITRNANFNYIDSNDNGIRGDTHQIVFGYSDSYEHSSDNWYYPDQHAIKFEVANSEDLSGLSTKLIIKGDGNVGIGNTEPASTLDVSGSIFVSDSLNIGSNDVNSTLNVTGTNGISLNTTDITEGIKIGTDVTDVPITIGNSSSLVTINDNLKVNGNLSVNGSTTIFHSTEITVEDPIITLGGKSEPSIDDEKDRGIEFRYYTSKPKIGFFGFDNSTKNFMMLTDATNNNEIFSGTKATLDANLDGLASVASTLTPNSTIDGMIVNGLFTISNNLRIGATDINATGTEFNFLSGVTSSIQSQLNNKSFKSNPSFDGKLRINASSSLNTVDINNNVAIGSGVAGIQEAPSDGLLVEGNSIFQSNVAIGYQTPSSELDVNGIVQSKYSFIGSNDTVNLARFGHINFKNDINSFAISQNEFGMTNINSKSNQIIQFSVNSSEKMKISNNNVIINGKIGIGIDSPESKLHVSGDIKNTGKIELDGNLILGGLEGEGNLGAKIKFNDSFGTVGPNKIDLYNNENKYGFGIRNAFLSYHTNLSHDFFINTSTGIDGDKIVKIDSSGLEVVNTINVGYDKDVTNILGKAAIGYNTINSDSIVLSHLDYFSNTGYAIKHDNSGQTTVNSFEGQPIKFKINDSEKMRVHSDGRIGINTKIPNCLVDIFSNDKIGDKKIFNITRNLDYTSTGSGSFDDILVNINYTGYPTLDKTGDSITALNVDAGDIPNITNKYAALFSGGNVGIGTKKPLSKLSVTTGISVGLEYASNNLAPYNGLNVQGNTGLGQPLPQNRLDVNGSVVIGENYSGNIVAPTNGLLVQGRIGINNTSPNYSLDVDGSINFNTALYFKGKPIIFQTSSEDIQTSSENVQTSSEDAFITEGINIFKLKGRVAIGTRLPDEKLHVQEGNIRIANTLSHDPKIIFADEIRKNNMIIEYDGSGNNRYLSIYNGEIADAKGKSLNIMGSNGFVGIGTTYPSRELEVSGDIKSKNMETFNVKTDNIKAVNTNTEYLLADYIISKNNEFTNLDVIDKIFVKNQLLSSDENSQIGTLDDRFPFINSIKIDSANITSDKSFLNKVSVSDNIDVSGTINITGIATAVDIRTEHFKSVNNESDYIKSDNIETENINSESASIKLAYLDNAKIINLQVPKTISTNRINLGDNIIPSKSNTKIGSETEYINKIFTENQLISNNLDISGTVNITGLAKAVNINAENIKVQNMKSENINSKSTFSEFSSSKNAKISTLNSRNIIVDKTNVIKKLDVSGSTNLHNVLNVKGDSKLEDVSFSRLIGKYVESDNFESSNILTYNFRTTNLAAEYADFKLIKSDKIIIKGAEFKDDIYFRKNILPTKNDLILGSTKYKLGKIFTSNINVDKLDKTSTGYVDISNNVNIHGTLDVSNNTQITGSLDVSGITNLKNRVKISKDLLVYKAVVSNNLDVSNNTNIAGSLDVSGITDLKNRVKISKDLLVYKAVVSNNLDVSNNTNIAGSLDVSGVTNLNNDVNILEDLFVKNTVISNNLDVSNNTNIVGSLDVSGVTNLNNDVNILEDLFVKNTVISNNLDVSNNTNIVGSLDVSGVTNLNNDVNILEDLFVKNTVIYNNLDVSNNTNIAGSLDVSGITSFNNDVNILEDLKVKGNLNISGSFKTESIELTQTELGYLDGLSSNVQTQITNTATQWTTSSSNIYYDSGNVGIGTTNPGAKLHIDGISSSVTGLTLANGSGINRSIEFLNNSNEYRMGLHYDSGNIQLYVVNQSRNPIVTFKESGNIGIGTTTPQSKLDVEGGVAIGSTYSGTTAAPSNGMIIEGNVGIGTTTPVNKLDVNGNIGYSGSLTNTSDKRLKENINEINLGLDFVNELNPVSFNRIGENEVTYGLVAQEVEEVFKKINIDKDDISLVSYNEKEDVYALGYTQLIAPLIKSVQEQDEKIKQLESENNLLKSQMNEILERLNKLENK